MIRILYRSQDGAVRDDVSLDELRSLHQEGAGLLWIDLQAESEKNSERLLKGIFAFHPLAVDDALQETHVPRVDDWERYLYLVLHAVRYDQQTSPHLETQELDLFLGVHYLITVHQDPIGVVQKVWERCMKDERMLKHGAARLLYHLVDALVAETMPVVDAIDDALERLEEAVFAGAQERLVGEIAALKRAVLHLRRILAPQREVLSSLARNPYAVFQAEEGVYFRDIYDHLVRLYDIVDSLREQASGVRETYLSVISNRMNNVMKTLTLISTMFMPVSFMASFFGMNIFAARVPMDLWQSAIALPIMLGSMALLPAVMYLWLRRKGWM